MEGSHPPSPAQKKSDRNFFEKWFYNYRFISYIITATVNKCKHSHDEATNILLRGSENTQNPDSHGYQIP